jgi:hypothetical protein
MAERGLKFARVWCVSNQLPFLCLDAVYPGLLLPLTSTSCTSRYCLRRSLVASWYLGVRQASSAAMSTVLQQFI